MMMILKRSPNLGTEYMLHNRRIGIQILGYENMSSIVLHEFKSFLSCNQYTVYFIARWHNAAKA